MAIPVEVPRHFAEQFEALAKLSGAEFDRLEAALRQLPPFGSQDAVIDAVAHSADEDVLDAETLAVALISILAQVPHMAGELADGISRSLAIELSDAQRADLATRLTTLLDLEALGSIGKADDIITDHEHVFRNARILTDVRPIFGDNVGSAPEAAVLIAMLRIDHSTHGRRESMYFALDPSDLASLKEVVDRATAKIRTLEDFLSAAGLAHYRHEERRE